MKALLPVVLVSTLCSSVALAHEAGDFFIRAGAAVVMPNESSDDVLNQGEMNISDSVQFAGTLSMMATDHIGFELLLATPFTHDVSTNGLGKIAEVSQLPPSLMIQYYFAEPDSVVRPYVGGGLNYTLFFDEQGKGALSGTDVSLDNSLGWTAQAGVDVNFADNWFANASIWYMDIDTTVHTAVGNYNAEINPVSVMLAVGYAF